MSDVKALEGGFMYGLMLSGSSSDTRSGEAKVVPTSNESIPIMIIFDPFLIYFTTFSLPESGY
jgi:hypothetical protein